MAGKGLPIQYYSGPVTVVKTSVFFLQFSVSLCDSCVLSLQQAETAAAAECTKGHSRECAVVLLVE
jgi:hypothetical protein